MTQFDIINRNYSFVHAINQDWHQIGDAVVRGESEFLSVLHKFSMRKKVTIEASLGTVMRRDLHHTRVLLSHWVLLNWNDICALWTSVKRMEQY